MNQKKNWIRTLVGGILFFLLTATITTIGIISYIFISEKSDNQALIAIVMLIIITFLALIATVVDYIRRKMTVQRPVQEILQATNRIASGDFSTRLEIKHDFHHFNEFDYIKENLNRMAKELSKTEVLHNDFVSNVSHELKTPLAIIQNYSTFLLKDEVDDETRRKYAETLVTTSKRLASLVTNILKLNKLENQSLVPEYETFRLDEMLAQMIIEYEDLVEEKEICLTCELEEMEITSCRNYLEIVWNNLFSNALKFTEMGGEITITLKKEKRKVAVSFSDTGCGISSKIGEHIFDKFYQGDTSHAKEGNGLGLALVKKVIDILGGEISVHSEVGKGSTFTVTFMEKEDA